MGFHLILGQKLPGVKMVPRAYVGAHGSNFNVLLACHQRNGAYDVYGLVVWRIIKY